jgi:ParB family chromosome partitioning protein
MARKPGLGKGLDALIPEEKPTTSQEGATWVPIQKVVMNPHQPRGQIIQETLQELADSIREHGILQPLIVTHDAENDQYVLIAGERRLKAAQIVDLESVPVIVRQATERQRLELALIENIQRADLTPLETAEAYRQLSEGFGLSHEEIARQVGKSRVAVTNNLRLLQLPPVVKSALAEEIITEGHARALLGLNSVQAQAAALETINRYGLNVRQTEDLVRKMSGEKPTAPPRKQPEPEVTALEDRLREHLGTKVTLRHSRKGGTLTLHYYSEEELDSLVKQLLKE